MFLRLLNNTKLRRKLFIAFFTFTCIIVLVAAMSFWFYSKRERVHEITEQIEEITSEVLKLTKLENNFFERDLKREIFFKRGKSEYHNKSKSLMQDLQRKVMLLAKKPEIINFKVDSKLIKLYSNLNEYDKTLNDVIRLYFQKGSRNYGLEGKLRDITAHMEMKGKIDDIDLLNLRRYEKDYLMQKDSVSLKNFTSLIDETKRKHEVETRDDLEYYEKHFMQIVSIDKILGISMSEEQLGLQNKLRTYSDTSIGLIDETNTEVEKRVKGMKGEFQNIFVITLLIVVVLSLTFSYFLSFFMTIPVTELSRSMQKAIEMNFSPDLKPARKYTNDEIGLLTDEFNMLIQRIQSQFKEIKSNAKLLQVSNTELQEINHQLANSEKRLEKFLLLKETLFFIITQDLKSPLNSLKGFLSLMQHHPDTFSPQELQEVASDMYMSFDRITVLMNSLEQWSQVQTGDFAYNSNTFNMTTLVEQVISQHLAMAQGKNIKITNDIKGECLVQADRNMINFTLRNLISNAIKFSHEGGKVEVSCKPRGTHATMFSIRDTGVGMSQELLEKVFQPEIHVSMLGTNNEKGSGFGLIMCKDFIRKNEGKIYIESELNKGTKVHFTLKNISTK